MSLNSLGLGFVFTARDLASGAIGNLERNFMSLDRRVGLGAARMQRAFQGLGMGMAILTSSAAALGVSMSLANAAGRFEEGVAGVAAVSGASASELEALHDAAIEAGIATQFSPIEATLGLRELAQAGFQANESMALLIPVLDLAAGSLGELSPQEAAGLAAQAMKAFGLSVDEAAISVDRMLQAVNVFALSAGELPLALGTASRGAQALHQSLSETLITLGLVKNIIPGVERASTAVAVAMERMADPDVQKRLRGIGVAVADSTGRFRDFLDILGEMAPALERKNDAQRSAFLLDTFGREALAGVNAILTQVTSGIRTSTGVTLRGADAIGYLREQFENAGGTAARFREKLLDTFEGQKKLLRGSLETLAIVLGEPFAQVFKPIVTAIVGALNGLLTLFRQMPASVKRGLAMLVVAAGSVVALVGAAIAAKASIALLAIGLKALGVTLGGIAAMAAPALGVIAVLGVAIAGFVYAFRHNLGGIADFARRIGEGIALAWKGLVQLFEQGGFSGAVREELGRADNQGLKQFLIRIYQVVYRIQRVWEGFRAGFTHVLDEAAPAFASFQSALSELGQEIGQLFNSLVGLGSGLPSSEFRGFGDIIGTAVATIIPWGIKLLTILTRVATGVIAGFRSMKEYLAPALDAVHEALGMLGRAWDKLMGSVNRGVGSLDESAGAWRKVGQVLGQVLGGIVTVGVWALAGLIDVITLAIHASLALKDAFIAAGTWIGETALEIAHWFTETLPGVIDAAKGTILGFFRAMGQFFVGIARSYRNVWAALADSIGAFLDPVVEFFRGVGRAIEAVFQDIADFVIRLLRKIPDSLLPESLERLKRQPLSSEVPAEDRFSAIGHTGVTAARAEAATSAMPAATEAQGRSQDLAQLEANLVGFANAQAARQGQVPPFQIQVQVDGETIARATHKAERNNAGRSFSPVPTY